MLQKVLSHHEYKQRRRQTRVSLSETREQVRKKLSTTVFDCLHCPLRPGHEPTRTADI